MPRAVVFDLWQTLAEWPFATMSAFRREWSAELGVASERFDELWYGEDFYRRRETGPIASAIADLYVTLGIDADVDAIVERRVELTRGALLPVPGALATMHDLRARGIAIGLISNCTEEVAIVWEETPFAGLFDAAVFSATAGLAKPDPEIYELALTELGVAASDTLFVGDGANQELMGAERVGMTPVLVETDGDVLRWDGLAEYRGLRIQTIPDVLALIR
jgi:putative hydrolase of the HAD superfamily